MFIMTPTEQLLALAYSHEFKKQNKGGLSVWRERLVKKLIVERLSESIEVVELANACSLSRSHFSRAFKRTTGLSPQEWIRHQRIYQAKQLIQNSRLSLAQISNDCGFSDQAHFCNAFIRSVGVTPLAWRNREVC
jgi:AraC-like DNA-binding protein